MAACLRDLVTCGVESEVELLVCPLSLDLVSVSSVKLPVTPQSEIGA